MSSISHNERRRKSHRAPVPIPVSGGALTGMNWGTNLRRRRSGQLHARRSNSDVRTSILVLVVDPAVSAREEDIVVIRMLYPSRMSAFGMPPRGLFCFAVPRLPSTPHHSTASSSYRPRDDRPSSRRRPPCISALLPSHSSS